MKYNKNASVEQVVASHPDITTNEEDAIAFKASPKLELYIRSMTCLVGEPQFYGKPSETTDRIKELVHIIAKTDPEFILKLAAYARNEMYLRSLPLMLLVEALDTDAKKIVRAYVPRIIRRADELSEVIALFITRNGQIGKSGSASLPNQFKKGLSDAFSKFDAYQFAKYKRDDKAVKLSDVIRLIHPTPENELRSKLYEQVRHSKVPIAKTWETVISDKGSNKESWESIIPKMGYMAKLRNLRNFVKHGVDLDPVVNHLINPKAVANSKQFPYRFWTAYKVLGGAFKNYGHRQTIVSTNSGILDTIIEALTLSTNNIPTVPGTTLVSSDNSGSMTSSVSSKSIVSCLEIACLMGAIADRICEKSISSAFGTGFEIVATSKHDSILTNMQRFLQADVGYATNGYKVLKWLNDNQKKVDRVMIFSDMQLWDTRSRLYGTAPKSVSAEWLKYTSTINPDAKLYLFDLSQYGTLQIPEDWPNVVFVSGWSDKVFDFIRRFEADKTQALSVIEAY